MSMLSIFDISGSALMAQSQRLNVSASNLANADSITGPNGQPYVAKQVIFSADNGVNSGLSGVHVSAVIDDPTPMKMVYQPENPLANDQGYVKMPNVNVVAETVNSISASRSYQANVEVLNTVKSLMIKTLTMGQ